MSLHPLAQASLRHQRKALLFAKWVGLGAVAVCFDASAPEVAVPQEFKHDIDMYFTVDDKNTVALPTGLEGTCLYPDGKRTFEFFITWGAITGLFSHALNEKHVYYEDYERAAEREKARKLSKMGKVLPS